MTWVATGTATEIAIAEAAAAAAAETAAAEAAAATAASAAAPAATTAITAAAPTAVTAAAPTGIAAVAPEAAAVVPEAAAPVVPAAEAPAAVQAPAGINQVANVPSSVMSDVGVNPDYTAWKNAIDAKDFVPQDNTLLNAMQNLNTPSAPSVSPELSPVNTPIEGAPPAPSTPPPANTPPATENSFMKGFTEFADKHPFMTGAGLYAGANALGLFNANAGTAPAGPTYAKSATLSPNFRGGPYTGPNVYKPHYAAGGITSVGYAPGGPVEQMGMQNNTMGANTMFPQSQQEHTQFATPSQMPTSAEVVDSDYQPKTNAYTGQMNMASGGIAGYRGGGKPDSAVPQAFTDMMDPYAKYRTIDDSSSIRSSGIVSDDDPDTKYADALTAALTRQGKIDKRANITSNAMKKPVPAGTLNFAAPGTQQAASGGIMGYSLGGYAAGGNPRLLKGPGDGMSDNIPATIGGRQPARLADGEFVVPADVVSHLGNGSTDAGAKKLHTMMDKVRMDRTGKKKQAPAVNPNKYMPK